MALVTIDIQLTDQLFARRHIRRHFKDITWNLKSLKFSKSLIYHIQIRVTEYKDLKNMDPIAFKVHHNTSTIRLYVYNGRESIIFEIFQLSPNQYI